MSNKIINDKEFEDEVVKMLKEIFPDGINYDPFKRSSLHLDYYCDFNGNFFAFEIKNHSISNKKLFEIFNRKYEYLENNINFVWIIAQQFISIDNPIQMDFKYSLIDIETLKKIHKLSKEYDSQDVISIISNKFTLIDNNILQEIENNMKKEINIKTKSKKPSYPIVSSNFIEIKKGEPYIFSISELDESSMGILNFKARINFNKVAGFYPLLKVKVGDTYLKEEDLLNKPSSYIMRDGRIRQWYNKELDGWMVCYSHDFKSAYNHKRYSPKNADPYFFVFDIKKYLDQTNKEIVFEFNEKDDYPYLDTSLVITKPIVE